MILVHDDDSFRAKLINQIDQAGDLARLSVIGDASRVTEYQRAEQHARAYKEAGYAGEVPSAVASAAIARGWSAQEEADDILAAAARWYAALDAIRALRLKAKEDIRKVTSSVEAETILSNYRTTLANTLQGVE